MKTIIMGRVTKMIKKSLYVKKKLIKSNYAERFLKK